jgi:hypothetical protein
MITSTRLLPDFIQTKINTKQIKKGVGRERRKVKKEREDKGREEVERERGIINLNIIRPGAVTPRRPMDPNFFQNSLIWGKSF